MALSRRRETIVWLANLPVVTLGWRTRLLRRAGIEAGPGVRVLSGLKVSRDGPLVVGAGTSFNHDVYVDTTAPVTIGRDVGIANHVRIVTAAHEIGPAARRAGALTTGAVSIGDGTWIGASTTILPGVRIGDGCVVGAGALVTADCAPHGLYVGVPARRVRDLPPR